MNILTRGKIYWLISDDSIIAFDKHQATVYQSFGCPNRHPFVQMKRLLSSSRENEYGTWVDVIGLAMKVKIIGYRTKLKKEWFEQIQNNGKIDKVKHL